jgi:hypothetical protein
MKQIMRAKVSACLYTLLISPVFAGEQLGCGSGDVLHFLAQTMQSTNTLVPTLAFDFNEMMTKRLVVMNGKVSDLQCTARVSLINQEDLELVSSLKVAYEIKRDPETGGYTLSFQPMR